jgi:hypothetical protein
MFEVTSKSLTKADYSVCEGIGVVYFKLSHLIDVYILVLKSLINYRDYYG